jgi:hypothetical protein
MPMPNHTDWKALKTKHNVPAGAVKGVNVGKLLEDYWSAKDRKAENAAAAKLEKGMAAYISKLDKTKVTKYDKFEKTFLNEYLNEARKRNLDGKRQEATLKTAQAEIAKFFAAVQKLNPKTTTKDDLQRFRQGPMRGLSALSSRAKDVDMGRIDELLAPIDDATDDLPDAPNRKQLAAAVNSILAIAKQVAKEADAKDLV